MSYKRGGVGSGRFEGRVKVARGDFSGEAPEGTTELDGDTVPAGAIVLNSVLVVREALAADADGEDPVTVSVGVESTDDIQTARQADANTYQVGCRPGSATGSNCPMTTEPRKLSLTVANGSLTGGDVSVVVSYIELV